MANLEFMSEAWDDYLYWQSQDKKTLRKINQLLKDTMRDHYHGIGKPEPLTGNLTGWWSRRIDEQNRMVYKVEGNRLLIAECRNHYGDK